MTVAALAGARRRSPTSVQFVGAAVSTSSDEFVAIPAHQVGDLIIIFAYRSNSDTIPAKPAASGTVPAWVDIDATNGSDTNSSRTAYFVATATNHTSGTWGSGSGATRVAAAVLRSQAGTPIGGHAESGGTGSTTTAPSVTMTNTDGTSVLLHFHGSFSSSANAWSSAPAGYTRRAAGTTQATVCVNTKDSTTSDGSVNQSCASGTRYRGATVEIRKT
jgi:hypothetical protein